MKLKTPVLVCSIALLSLVACDDSSSATREKPADGAALVVELSSDVQPMKLEFLRVHLRSDFFIADGLTEVPGYRLAYQELRNEVDGTPLLDKEGNPRTLQYWIETAEAASEKEYYLCEKDIAKAEADLARPEYIYIEFTEEGSRKMKKLTSSFVIGREMLAIVVNGKVCAAPVVQDTLSKQVAMNVFHIPGERDELLRSLQAAIRRHAE